MSVNHVIRTLINFFNNPKTTKMNVKKTNLPLKKMILNYSFLFLALLVFISCEKGSLQDEVSIEEMEINGSDKDNSGSIGSSDGGSSDEDYN